MSVRFLIGDARSRLKELPDESVHCCVTSPPYFGLRDYGTAQWDGGDPACDHRAPSRFDYALNSGLGPTGVQTQGSNAGSGTVQQFRSVCGKCGARRIDSQIGLEESPAAYVAELVAVFREVRRVLRSDGTVFLNIGDSYAQNEIRHRQGDTGSTLRNGNCKADEAWAAGTARTGRKLNHGLKPKDLIGVPWRLAFALQEDGWWLRQDIIWSKPNPMPESVTDRCTKSHEYVFLLTKSASYAYDAQAIAEPSAVSVEDWKPARGQNRNNASTTLRNDGDRHGGGQLGSPGIRNKRSVWTIATAPFSEAHFATFPPELPELCIRAGTSERGCCPHCGKGWARVVERGQTTRDGPTASGWREIARGDHASVRRLGETQKETLCWRPSCSCSSYATEADAVVMLNFHPVPATVLDPFAGAGTTGLVADRLGRNAILIELNPAYADMARKRIESDAGMFACLEAAE